MNTAIIISTSSTETTGVAIHSRNVGVVGAGHGGDEATNQIRSGISATAVIRCAHQWITPSLAEPSRGPPRGERRLITRPH